MHLHPHCSDTDMDHDNMASNRNKMTLVTLYDTENMQTLTILEQTLAEFIPASITSHLTWRTNIIQR